MSKDEKTLELPPNTFINTLGDGTIEVIDMVSGVVLATSKSMEAAIKGNVPWEAVEQPTKKYVYTREVAEYIAHLVESGKSLTRISKMPGMPGYGFLKRWEREHEEFSKMLDRARKGRAEHYVDEIADSLLDIYDKDEVPEAKLKFEKRKYLAKMGDPDKYGDRTKISGDAAAPLQLIIETGIDRSGQVEFQDNNTIEGEISEKS